MAPRHPRAPSRRPEGIATRGKTRPNRLRHVDTFIARYDPGLIARESGVWAGAWAVDLGYGAEPFTALEMAARLRRINPRMRLLGVEIDPARVAAAQHFADAQTHFRLGGFNLPLGSPPEPVRLIRAFNVLRQYDQADVAPAWQRMAAYLLPGGLLIEGTSDPLGQRWVTNVLRKQEAGAADEGRLLPGGLRLEALVFRTTLRAPFDPAALQPVLPKSQIHRMVPGEPIEAFFVAWKQSALQTVATQAWGPRAWFVAAAHHLAEAGWRVDPRRSWLRDGYLILRSLDPP